MARKLRRELEDFTNGIVANRPAGRNPWPVTAGAGSFTRWLGCAPQVIARVRHSPQAGGALTAARLSASVMMPNGPPRGAHNDHRAPYATGLSLDSALGSNRTDPTDPGSDEEPTTWVFTKELSCSGMRSLTNRA